MTIFGLNSPEIFILLVIVLVILGTKRIEKGIDLFSRLLRFLLSNQTNNKIAKKRELTKEIEEAQENKEEIIKIEEKTNVETKDPKEIEETQSKEDKSEKRLKKTNVDNNEKESTKIKDPKEI